MGSDECRWMFVLISMDHDGEWARLKQWTKNANKNKRKVHKWTWERNEQVYGDGNGDGWIVFSILTLVDVPPRQCAMVLTASWYYLPLLSYQQLFCLGLWNEHYSYIYKVYIYIYIYAAHIYISKSRTQMQTTPHSHSFEYICVFIYDRNCTFSCDLIDFLTKSSCSNYRSN